jgi:acetyl esterase/lipase
MGTTTYFGLFSLSRLILRRKRPRRKAPPLSLDWESNSLEERLLLSGSELTAPRGTAAVVEDFSRSTARSTTSAKQKVYRDITYTVAGLEPQRLDVYVPLGSQPPGGWPVIVAIHGGGWRRLDKRDYGQRIASAFVPSGYAVVAPNYPLSAPDEPTWPIGFEAIQKAVMWVKENAGNFEIDPSRVVAMGESAGGNLANLLGTNSPSAAVDASGYSSAVAAVIGFSSPTDLAALYTENPRAGKAVAQFLGGTPTQVPAIYLAASPVDQVSPADPAVFLVHGASDPLVPLSQSEELAAALTRAGVPNKLVVIPGSHNLDFPLRTPRNLVLQILEFLSATWNDKGSQSLKP